VRVSDLEKLIDAAEIALSPLKTFILPTGCEAAARLHMARSQVRFAEQEIVDLAKKEAVREELLSYINRLSDLLFVWARFANHIASIPDVQWVAD